ncbi:cancer-related regulator of actin dynamics isoform X2 [Coturnix japonica]|uniref:cancer-related regulator of actin dynamics isoform X2 n=1 Tax=Coturnix japonica TaxID=93934 RepID=UPI0007772ACC|nr:cancer-related regulator of actin dynamics isoform X2 [Coturnix japonica]
MVPGVCTEHKTSSHYSMGSRAFSHDSIFIPDGRTESEQAIQAMSQENVLGKVKTLQQQLAKNIKFGQPPQMTVSGRTMGEANASIEEDVFLGSLMEIDSQQDTAHSESGNKSADTPDLLRPMNLPGTGQMEEKVTPVKSSRPKRQFSCSGTIETINLDAVPQAVARLDNSAAKHKLSVKPKKQRMSRKHKRLTKGSQSLTITEFEPEDLETELFVDRYPGYNGHITADKLIQNRDEPKQLQLAEEKRTVDHWGILEAEKIRQIVEMEEQRELEEQRCQELEEQMQKEQERRDSEKESSQYLLEGEISLKIEVQACQEERGLLEAVNRQEPDDQSCQELEEQRHRELEEQQRPEMEQQKCEEQGEQQRQELEEQKHQEWEKQERWKLEEQKHWAWDEQQGQELEEQKFQEHRQELEKQKHWEQEEQQRQELEEQKCQEEEQQRQKLEEQMHWELEEQKRQELEEQKHQECEEQRQKELEEQGSLELEELRQHETEKWCQKEEERNLLEEQKELVEQNKEEKQRQELEEEELPEAEIKLKQEKEAEGPSQQKKEEEEMQHMKERGKTEEEQPQKLLEKKQKREEPRKHKLIKQMHLESTDIVQQDELKQQKEQECNKLEEQKIDTERQNVHWKQQEKSSEQQNDKNELSSGGADRNPADDKLQERLRPQKVKQPEKENKTAEEILAQKLKREVDAQEQKRIGEELRWQEVDERQTASRPFTFQVSSGDKQIIFQKVNLSPVMPAKGAGLSSPSIKDSRMHMSSKGSHTLPSSVCVPHTAILVTGAQLCGTAVNLNQIKDTACKSLLGLTEEKKNVDIPSPEKAQKKSPGPKPSISKTKYTQESLDQATLAEWASIRSRILKNKENGKYNEKDRVNTCRHSDDWTPRGRGSPHGNLRKTLSANAKFSITPAWQKFSEGSKTNSVTENVSAAKGSEKVAAGRNTGSSVDANEGVVSTFKDNLSEVAKEKTETHSEIMDNTEGCKFAKDLPSFLVPGFPRSPGKELPQSELPGALENQQSNNSTKKADKPAPNGEENVSPFGIKLRRTNYSLRFHYDQQAEQRKKKRYSAGDSFDGVPDPLLTTEGEKESAVFAPQESASPGTEKANVHGNLKDSKDSSVTVLEISQPVRTPLPATSQSALPPHEKPACKSLFPQKPALAPKPASQTPPSSPLSKMNRSHLADTLGQRFVKAESDGGWRKDDRAVPPVALNESKNEEEEIREKKSFFPSLSIPWREKNDKKPEPLKKEKPVLLSRHSLDGSKLMEKVEASQPLWITLALQKQKGFREQQATREERRQAREAKQAEKLAKEIAAVNNQSDNKSGSSSKTSTLQKSTTQEGEKKIETAVSRLERREQLKKSNTLPTSVTVEISDSVPPTPLAKEVAKRFSTPDANPVSTEPAWLALAKRKAKAWSDCPQIIK